MYEETGLSASQEDLILIPKTYEADLRRKGGYSKRFTMRAFVCNRFEGIIKETDETAPEWVSVSRLDEYNLIANTVNVVHDGLPFRLSWGKN